MTDSVSKTVMHLIDTTGPGGAETVFVDIVENTASRGYRCVAVIRGDGWVRQELERRGITPVILAAKGSFNWRFLLALIRLVRLHQVDVIHSHLLGSNVYAAIVGLFTFRAVIATFHGVVDIEGRDRFKLLRKIAMALGVKYFVAVSNVLAKNLVAQGYVNERKLKVIYNGIDTSKYGRDHNTFSHPWLRKSGSILIGCLGNIRPAKAYDVLIDAIVILSKSVNENDLKFQVSIAGQGCLDEKSIDVLACAELDDQVHLLGFCDDSPAYLSGLDIFVLSSHSEGFSIATIEALASGVPVISTLSGGPEEILDNEETGLMVETDNPAKLAAAILRLMRNETLRKMLAAKGKKSCVDRFHIDVMVDAYIGLYGS